ncbi:MAG: Cobalt-precorrin-5B C(1)-methyltransferase [Anaerolineae bacterium]|nr:Cobalt-precorrin-5B C(1)-methyltransferase [Anaerolineae bacterium]
MTDPRPSRADWRKPNLREGFTTGACAAAAAAAATQALVTGQPVAKITIDLPVRPGVTFALARCEFHSEGVTCGVIKDAGDDPDVTHGAEIQATVEWRSAPGIELAGGEGVGVVTKPGLPVEVGEPAINPVPRRMIIQAVLAHAGARLAGRGLKVTISVPNGAAIARQTFNPKLGIIGGISILGTTGIVKPFSQSAYRASIYVELKVAAQNGVQTAVFTTGDRSERYARRRYPALPDLAFLQVGDHMDYALKQARRLKLARVVISTMIGKVSKMAQGRFQTHVSEGSIDHDFLAESVRQLGVDDSLAAQVRGANTAHHVQQLLRRAGVTGLEARLAQQAAEQAGQFIGGAYSVEVLCFDLHGELLAVGQFLPTRKQI